MTDASGVRAVVELLAKTLSDRPEQVSVSERQHRGTTIVEVFVPPSVQGRLIGRQGRTIAALRTLVACAAEKDGQTATVEIRDAKP